MITAHKLTQMLVAHGVPGFNSENSSAHYGMSEAIIARIGGNGYVLRESGGVVTISEYHAPLRTNERGTERRLCAVDMQDGAIEFFTDDGWKPELLLAVAGAARIAARL